MLIFFIILHFFSICLFSCFNFMVTQEAYDRVVERRDQLQAANANLTERFNDAQREIEHLRNQNAVLINTNAMLVGLLRDNQNMQQQNPPQSGQCLRGILCLGWLVEGPPPYQYMHQLQLYDPGQQQNFGRRSNGKNLLCISSSRSTSSGLTQSSIKKPQYLDSRKFRFELLDNIDTFVFDADGVLWLDENEIGGSVSFIEYIAKLGKKIIILTNNAIKSRAVYANELTGFGYGRYINGDNVVNPAAVIADLIHRSALVNKGKKVYLIGSQCLKYELDVLNIDYFCDGTDLVDIQSSSNSQAFKIEEHPDNVGAVVVGFDKYCNVLNLMKAANYLKSIYLTFLNKTGIHFLNEDCLFFATTEEETCPCPNLTTIGAAPLVAAVKTASGREPLIVGKSSAPAFEFICRLCGVDDPRRILMIGDRLNTEVKFEYDNGLRTLLVFSQCHGLDVIEDGIPQSRDDLVPEFYAECLGALIPKSENN
ncbi:hypothetical protein Mgra_00004022 [Meloidogyne graminicola]|uniref:Uncharacterized protein n=1 Tax=Meloidogyne graminicola TaxID=189291 RepID=A0A8S9ZTV8_9BILA|nr:hypothetical protein Mgra_00004022 [Meloidogyne graminicola]